MSQFYNQEFVIFRAANEMWNFFHREGTLLYKVRNADGIWTKEVQLANNVIDDFCVDIDTSDNIHLVCMSSSGQILYFMHDGTNWYNKKLALFPVEKYRIKQLTISTYRKYINIFFALSSRNNPMVWSIQHYSWNGSRWKNMSVAKITAGQHFSPFYAGYDQSGTIHMLYKALRFGTNQLYYCKFHPQYSIWSNPERITETALDNNHPYMLTDKKDTLHIAWSCPINSNLQIKYLQKTRISYPKGYWRKEAVVSSGTANNTHPLIYIIEKTVWVIWINHNRLLASFSHDNGNSWSNPIELDVFTKYKPSIFSLVTNNQEFSRVIVDVAFGYKKGDNIIFPVIDEALNRPAIQFIEKAEGNEADSSKEAQEAHEQGFMTSIYPEKPEGERDKTEDAKKAMKKEKLTDNEEIHVKYQTLDDVMERLGKIKSKLDNLKEENCQIISLMRQWEDRYLQQQKFLEEIEGEYNDLSSQVEKLAQKNIIRRIINYFK